MKSMASVLSLVESILASSGTYTRYVLDTTPLKENLALHLADNQIDIIAKALGGSRLGVGSNKYAFEKAYGPERMLRKLIRESQKLNDMSTEDTVKAGKQGVSSNLAFRKQYLQQSRDVQAITANGTVNEEVTQILAIMNKFIESDVLATDMTTRHRITNSQGKYEYVLKISSGVSTPNKEDLKYLSNRLREALKDYATEDTLMSLTEYVDKAMYAAFNNKPMPSQDTVVNTKGKAKRKTEVNTPKVPRPKISAVGNRIRSDKGQFANLPRILGYINSIVHTYVRRNMAMVGGTQLLRYRTGRFSNSVKVLGLAATKTQAINLTYTYMLHPYQTFEPGFRQGSIARDPRKLIDKSIRMLMKEAFTSSGLLITTNRI